MIHHITRATRHLIFWSLLSVAIALSVIRSVVLYIDLYKTELETELSQLLEAPVKIGHLSAYMHRFTPEIVLKEIQVASVHDNKQAAINLAEIRLSIDLLDVLLKQHLLGATQVSLIGAKLSIIRKLDGKIMIVGLKSGDDQQPLWLLQGNHYQLLDSEIIWQDEAKSTKPLTFKNVDISIRNYQKKQYHLVQLTSQLPTHYGKHLTVIVGVSGDILQPGSLTTQFFIQGQAIRLSNALNEYLPFKLNINSGNADFNLWGNWQDSTLSNLTGTMQVKSVNLQRADKKQLTWQNLSGVFAWQKQNQNWSLAVKNLQLQQDNMLSDSSTFALGSPNISEEQFSANIEQLDLESVAQLGQFFAPLWLTDKQHDWLDKISVGGQIQHTLLFADLKQNHYALKGQFDKLNIDTFGSYPGFKNLSGSIQGTEKQGSIHLASQDAQFVAQSLFRWPLKINVLNGQLHWQQQDDVWQLSSPNLVLNTPDLDSNNTLRLEIPKQEKPVFMDLYTTFTNGKNANAAPKYFPVGIMDKDVLNWLDNAFISGQVSDGRMSFYGNLTDFPFLQQQGVFQVLFNAHNFKLNYAPGWPALEALDAEVMFLNESLDIRIQQAKALKVPIKEAHISIPSFANSQHLLVQGKTSTSINAGLDFLAQTPLDLPTQKIAEQLSTNSNADVNLDLKIALSDRMQSQVDVNAQLKDAQMTLTALDLPINRINGTLKVSQAGISSDNLQAFAFAEPIKININTNPQATQIDVQGKVGIKNLQKQFSLPEQNIATGSSAYTLQLRLPSNQQPPHLQIKSDLTGIALNLPNPVLAKNYTESKNLLIELNLTDANLIPVKINYNQQLQSAANIDRQNKKLHSANILLGSGNVAFPTEAGLKLQVKQASFEPLAWLALLKQFQSSDTSSLVKEISVDTEQLYWEQKSLGKLSLKLQRQEKNWLGKIDALAAKGEFQIPISHDLQNKINLNMEYLNLSVLAELKLPEDQSVTEVGTLFEVQSEKLLWRGVNLGKLTINSERNATGTKFKRIEINHEQQKLFLEGEWRIINNQSFCVFNGELQVKKFADLLKKLRLYQSLEETSAVIKLDLNWYNRPYNVSFAQLNGGIDISLKNGRILSIEPGFGRVLGILAIAQWIKRLQLDFGDVYKEGLTFNTIKGYLNLKNGKATNQNLIVDAVPAKISLSGEIDLDKQVLNQQVSVIPKSSDAIPIAGTIIGSIAAVIGQTLTGEDEEGFYLRTKYNVQGPWDNLTVTPLYDQDGLLQKTWRGLTDFSWINQ